MSCPFFIVSRPSPQPAGYRSGLELRGEAAWCALLCSAAQHARALSLLFLSSSPLSLLHPAQRHVLADRPPLPRSRYWVGPRPSRREPAAHLVYQSLPNVVVLCPDTCTARTLCLASTAPPVLAFSLLLDGGNSDVIIAALIVRGSPTPCPPWLPVSRCQRSNNQAPFFKPSEPSLPRRLEFRLQPMANTPLWSLLHVLPRS